MFMNKKTAVSYKLSWISIANEESRSFNRKRQAKETK